MKAFDQLQPRGGAALANSGANSRRSVGTDMSSPMIMASIEIRPAEAKIQSATRLRSSVMACRTGLVAFGLRPLMMLQKKVSPISRKPSEPLKAGGGCRSLRIYTPIPLASLLTG